MKHYEIDKMFWDNSKATWVSYEVDSPKYLDLELAKEEFSKTLLSDGEIAVLWEVDEQGNYTELDRAEEVAWTF